MSWLDRIDVASPCPVSWDSMTGDQRKRFCDQCQEHVYDLSGMTRDQAEDLVRRGRTESVCVRFYRRADGTVLTADCPSSVRRGRTRLPLVRSAIAASLSAVAGLTASGCEPVNATHEPPRPPARPTQPTPAPAPTPTPTPSQVEDDTAEDPPEAPVPCEDLEGPVMGLVALEELPLEDRLEEAPRTHEDGEQ